VIGGHVTHSLLLNLGRIGNRVNACPSAISCQLSRQLIYLLVLCLTEFEFYVRMPSDPPLFPLCFDAQTKPLGMSSTNVSTEAAHHAIARLAEHLPDPQCELMFNSPFELLVATVLSAQCTDERVNQVIPSLFERFPTVRELAAAGTTEIESIIHSTGFYRAKARNIQACAMMVVEDHDGEMPRELDALCRLPGVGRKTANLVLGVAFRIATGVVVDTHAGRVSQRLGLTTQSKADKIECDLMALVPKEQWIDLGHRLVLHGRHTCTSKRPQCDTCAIRDACPQIGVS